MSDELPGFDCGPIEIVGEPLVGATIWWVDHDGTKKLLWMCWDEVLELHNWLAILLTHTKEVNGL